MKEALKISNHQKKFKQKTKITLRLKNGQVYKESGAWGLDRIKIPLKSLIARI